MKFNKSSGLSAQRGQASRLLLVLAVIVLVAVVITFLIMRMAEKPPNPAPGPGPEVSLPVYEATLGDIRFVFESAIDKGNILKVSDIKNSQYTYSSQKDLSVSNSGAKFIKVTIGAQNMGTVNTEQKSWDIEDIVDSEGRHFVPLEGYIISPWLPNTDLCGTLLKPAFDPTPCTKIYEVSKQSSGFKIKVETGIGNSASNFSSGKIDSALINLIVK